MALRHGSLFSGIGMIDYGLELAGFETAWQVEKDLYCRAVLQKHWPDVPKHKDVKDCGQHNLTAVDLISGGFPCIDISGAGLKAGIGTQDAPTSRSGLWYEFHRIIQELRPHWVLIENVSRLVHTADGEKVISQMEGAGYACCPLVLGARVLGAPFERKRAWILCARNDAYSNDDVGAGVGPPDLLPAATRAMEEACQEWLGLEHELASGVGRPNDSAKESESAAYADLMREVYVSPVPVERLKRIGNSAVFIIPALIGSWVAQVKKGKNLREKHDGTQAQAG